MKRIIITSFIFILLLPAKATDWRNAQWIWQEEDGPVNGWVSFRKEFILQSVPGEALAAIAVDSKYWLWINGEMVVFEGGVARGPSPAGGWDRKNKITPSNTWYEHVDIASYLQEGQNTIAILVWYWGRETHKGTHIDSGKGGLLFSCDVGSQRIVSDSSWKAIQHPGYSDGVPPASKSIVQFSVIFNAEEGLNDWTDEAWYTARFDDGNWPSATEKGNVGAAPWYDLVENYVPQLVNHGLENYVNHEELNMPFLSEGGVIECKLPFNQQVTPYMEVESEGGDTIFITTDNRLNKINATYITKAGSQSFESFSWMNGHVIEYTIPAGVKVKALNYRWTSVGEMIGQFSISDPFYDRLWEMGNNTLFVCARDNFMDCPDRERALWIGDVADQTGYLFYSMSEAGRQLLKKAIIQTINFSENKVIGALGPYRVRELVGQSLQFIAEGIWPYYLHTGDKETLGKAYPYVKNYLSLFPMEDNGLPEYRKGKSPDSWDWVDWGVKGTQDAKPIQAAYYYMALNAGKQMAATLGESEDLTWYNERMIMMKSAYEKAFWKDGFYSSDENQFKDDRANALAITSGVAFPKHYDEVVRNVLIPIRNSSPHFEWVVEEAMCLAGKHRAALDRMKDQYRSQVENKNQTTLYEMFPKGGSYNHAWNAPNTILSEYILGVRPTKPGWSEFEVMPTMVDFKSIDSRIPTVKGEIGISLQQNDQRFQLEITQPDSVTAFIGIPKKGKRVKQIIANNEVIWKKGKFKKGQKNICLEQRGDRFLIFKSTIRNMQMVAEYD